MNEVFGIVIQKCPVCGKDFVPAPNHAYKVAIGCNDKYVCSWKCLRDYEKVKEAEKAERKEASRIKRIATMERKKREAWEKAEVEAKRDEFGKKIPDPFTEQNCIYEGLREWLNEHRMSMDELTLVAYSSGDVFYKKRVTRFLKNTSSMPKHVIDNILKLTGMTYEVAFRVKEKEK